MLRKKKALSAQTFPVEYLHRMLKKWQKSIFTIPYISKLWTKFTIVFMDFIKVYSNVFIKANVWSTLFCWPKKRDISKWFINEDFCFFRKIEGNWGIMYILTYWKESLRNILLTKEEEFITCPSCNMFVWHKSCIEKICVDFSLNKPDFSSEKWTCPNCCKIWIIMCFWIHLNVVDHKVNKKSTLYWLMCHEHF